MAVILFPREIEEDWGKDKVVAFVDWLEVFIKEKAGTRDEHKEILSRLDVIENTLEHIEKEQSEQRRTIEVLTSQMNERFDAMSQQFNERFDRMNERFDRMNERLESMMKWTVATLALFGSFLAILMSIYKFLG
jgi:hypothetical protein